MFKSPFFEERVAQVAAYFLHQAGGSLEILKLMKLMYLAERHALAAHGEPITGDTPFGLEHGPVLSASYNQAKAPEAATATWGALMLPRDGNDISLRSPGEVPATPKLSRAHRLILDEVWAQFGPMTGSQVRRWTHENCPEYDDPLDHGVKRLPIDPKRLLMAVGFDEAAADERLRELREQAELQRKLPAYA